MKFRTITGSLALLLAFLSTPALAFSGDALHGANTSWVLTATALVLFMTLPGLALFYGGLVRSRNVLSVLMQCFAIASGVSILWLLGFYSLAFTDGGSAQPYIGGFGRALMLGVTPEVLQDGLPEIAFAGFQMTFAVITPALVVGGFAERMRFSSVLVFSMLWTLCVYVPVCHWVWGGGFLGELGLLDFAGGTVVHITAGVAALVSAIVLGKRKGFPQTPMPPHNMTMTVVGAGMLWVGWYGFNGGSALSAGGSAAMAMFVTHISASSGALAWILLERIKYGKPSVLGAVTGMVAGLGTITPASGHVGPLAGLVIGVTAGAVCFWATGVIKHRLHIDDSLDVFPVHGVGGILGTLLVGVFASPALGAFSGYGYGSGVASMGHQLVVQGLGVAVTIIYTGALTFALLKLVGWVLGGLRVNDEEEALGLDLSYHGERGYDL